MRRIEKLALTMVLLGIAFIAMGPACPLGENVEKNYYYTTNITTGSSGSHTWSMVGGGDSYTQAIRDDGTLWACGMALPGGAGPSGTDVLFLTQIGVDTDWQAVACGEDHILVLKTNGTLWAWGDNGNGQLGLADTTQRLLPVRVGTDTDWVEIAAGRYHSLARKSDGTLHAWGQNNSGQLGLGHTNTPISVTTQVGTGSNWTAIAGGFWHTLAISTSGSTRQLWVCGKNTYAELGLGYASATISSTMFQVGTAANWAELAVGTSANWSLARQSDGTIWAWGKNDVAQLGLGYTSTSSTAPTKIGTDTDWAEITAGINHGFARKSTGTVWTWGENGYGQCGQGDWASPVTTPTQAAGFIGWVKIGGDYNTCYAVDSDGTFWGWGASSYYELATGEYAYDEDDIPIPVRLKILDQ